MSPPERSDGLVASGAHSPSPVERLARRPGPFDFFQAVALLEASARGQGDAARWEEVGKELDPEREVVRFRSSPSLGFAEADLTRVELRGPAPLEERRKAPRHDRRGGPHASSMEVSFFGLTGVHGALPLPFAELVARRDHLEGRRGPDGSRHEAAMRELLDIFNSRLLALYYRAGKRSRPALGAAAPAKSPLLAQVASAIGLGTPSLLDSARSVHRPALHTAGIAAREARSSAAIAVALGHALGLPGAVRVIPFTGEWVSIEPSDRTSLGRTGRNHLLGRTAVLGARVFDPASGVRVEVGSPEAPLSYRDFRSLMPGGDRFSTLCQMTRFLAGASVELSIRATYVAADAPAARLRIPGAPEPSLLGLTAVLGRRRPPPAKPRTRTVTVRAAAVRRLEERERRRAAAAPPGAR
jgi:type VI secretion system protein ImpH